MRTPQKGEIWIYNWRDKTSLWMIGDGNSIIRMDEETNPEFVQKGSKIEYRISYIATSKSWQISKESTFNELYERLK